MEVQLFMQMRSRNQLSSSNYGEVFLTKLTTVKNALSCPPPPHPGCLQAYITIVFPYDIFIEVIGSIKASIASPRKKNRFLTLYFLGTLETTINFIQVFFCLDSNARWAQARIKGGDI